MLSFLKNHPFAVEAFFESSLVLTYAFPISVVKPLVPDVLSVDDFNGNAFIAVAIVKTKKLRPKGFPHFLGNNFTLIGYRVFVKYIDQRGKRLRGLYILKSDTDKKSMQYIGNLLTQYKYTCTDININSENEMLNIWSIGSGFSVQVDYNAIDVELPVNSPFASWKEARRFAGPLPYTFTTMNHNEVLIVEGVRSNWTPRPIKVTEDKFSFINSVTADEGILANAFIVENIPYYWKKGRVELCR